MAGLAGFEPTHDGVKVRCLTAWRQPNILNLCKLLYLVKCISRYRCANCYLQQIIIKLKPQRLYTLRLYGDPSEIRTPDTLIKSQVLCQLS